MQEIHTDEDIHRWYHASTASSTAPWGIAIKGVEFIHLVAVGVDWHKHEWLMLMMMICSHLSLFSGQVRGSPELLWLLLLLMLGPYWVLHSSSPTLILQSAAHRVIILRLLQQKPVVPHCLFTFTPVAATANACCFLDVIITGFFLHLDIRWTCRQRRGLIKSLEWQRL